MRCVAHLCLAPPSVSACPTAGDPKFCSQCGQGLAPGAKFCSECGEAHFLSHWLLWHANYRGHSLTREPLHIRSRYSRGSALGSSPAAASWPGQGVECREPAPSIGIPGEEQQQEGRRVGLVEKGWVGQRSDREKGGRKQGQAPRGRAQGRLVASTPCLCIPGAFGFMLCSML